MIVMLESTLKAVDENKNITDEVKQDIKRLINRFVKIFPNISLENLKERIGDVRVEKTKKLVSKKSYEYKPKENVLCFRIEALQNNYNAEHLMMSGLLCMMTAHDNTYGFATQDHQFISLNVGFTEMLSNFLVGNVGEDPLYEDELIATNILAELIGIENFLEAYFQNNAKLIAEKIVEVEQGEENYVRGY